MTGTNGWRGWFIATPLYERRERMKLVDLTGPLSNDMWQFGDPFPVLNIEARTGYKEGFGDFSYTAVEGLHALTGTYVETPAHFLGYENSYLIGDVPLERLVGLDCVVLNIETAKEDENGRLRVTLEDLQACPNSGLIREGDAILVGVGWGDAMWFSQDHFPKSPYFNYQAFMWLLEKRPCVIGTDTSSWEDLTHPSGFFPKFYEQDILMLAGLMNLKSVSPARVKLSILPLRLENSCASPCRAFIQEGS